MSQTRSPAGANSESELDAMLERIHHLTDNVDEAPAAPPQPTPAQPPAGQPAPPQPARRPANPAPQQAAPQPPRPAQAGPPRPAQRPANTPPAVPAAPPNPGQPPPPAPQQQPANPGILSVNNQTGVPQQVQTGAPRPAQPGPPPAASQPQPSAPAPAASLGLGGGDKPREKFFPTEPRTILEAGLNDSLVTELALKYLLARGEDSGQGIADQVKLPFTVISELMTQMKYDQLIHYRDTAKMGDYICTLTDKGRDRARAHASDCTYYGAAPVALEDYCSSVGAQSLTHQNPNEEDLRRAFSDLLVNPSMFLRLGAAMNSGRGMFLFGYPGNGKTSIAERVTRAFGEHIWIPRSIGVDGEIIRVFDPSQHDESPPEEDDSIILAQKVDTRWVRIKRPTIIVGGELTMDNLELAINPATGINEAPVQLKSNCGTLVIDDFGRQRMTTDELLNRWIVPLEKRYDFLNLPSGKKVQVPFDQLVIFSTNLEPKDLVDDAFLRRIPYKIEVENPTEEEFVKLFEIMCPLMGFTFDRAAVDYLIKTHYKPIQRPFRCCQPRDLLLQIKNYCKYTQRPISLSPENFDFATTNYFSVM